MRDEARALTALAPAPDRPVGRDPHDFAGLFIRHRASFTSHARRYLRDPRDADEVVQEAFLRLFLVLPELESELQALAYGRRTITNLCIDRYRCDARRPRLVALEGQTVDELAEVDTGDPVVRAEDAALVREALSRLPALHRAALVKREVEEKPLPVIADELDVAEDSVKHLLFRARRTLRKLLAGTSVAPGADAERTRGLRPAASGASGGLAGLLVLVLVGLGSGPDLRAVPVVGVDLPDVLGVTAVVDAVTDVVHDAVEAIVPGQPTEATAAPRPPASGPADSSGAEAAGGASSTTAVREPVTRTRPTGTDPGATAPGAPAPAVRPAGPPAGSAPTTVVTVVDGVPVLTAVPPTVAVPGASAPGAAAPGAAAPGVAAPGVAGRPTTGTVGEREAPVRAGVPPVSTPPVAGAPPAPPVTAVTPVRAADPPARPVGPTTPDRVPVEQAGPGAGKAADKTAEKADKAAEKAAKAAEKAAEKAERAAARPAPAAQQARAPEVVVEKAAERAAQASSKGAAKAEHPAPPRPAKASADKAADKAEKAADKADKTADKAVAKNEKATGKTAAKGEKATGKAAAARQEPAAEVVPAPAATVP